MYYHTDRGWSRRTPGQNRSDKEKLVFEGESHGVLVYHKNEPVGWCQYGPTKELPRIDRLRDYKVPVPDGLWRVTCFFVDKRYRGRGVTRIALRSALRFMKLRGAKVVETYPVDTAGKRHSSRTLWWGPLNLY